MADVLIKGMDMPTEEEISKCIIVRHDGEVWIVEFDNLINGGYVACYPTNPMRAVSVPPYGRLIDANELYEKTAEWEAQALDLVERHMHDEDTEEWRKWSTVLTERSAFKFDVADAPTVIEASEVE